MLRTPSPCVARESGECRGPIVADLVLQAKEGRRNFGDPVKAPLCVVHAVKGALLSWFAHAGGKLLWSIRASLVPGARKGIRITHRVVAREPWRSVLRDLGITLG